MSKNNAKRASDFVDQPPTQPDVQLDVSDKVDLDRLRAIDEARRQVRDIRETTTISQLKGQVGTEAADIALREALESYLLEIKQYRDCDESARKYWDGSAEGSIGQVVISPPVDHDEFEDCEAVTVETIEGLDDILYSPRYFSHTFETTIPTRHGPNQDREITVNQPLSRSILQRALEWANTYVHHIGLDLQLQDTLDSEAEAY